MKATLAPIASATRLVRATFASSLALALPMMVAACSGVEPGGEEERLGSSEQAIQNGDPGSAVPGIVYVYAATAQSHGSCSGVMLTNKWLLTARHCVVDDAGNVASKNTVVIQGGGLQNGVAAILPHAVRDVALVALNAPWTINGSTEGFLRPLTPYSPAQLLLSPVYCAGYGEGTTAGGGSGTLRNFSSIVSWAAPDNSTFFVPKNLNFQVQRKGDSGGGCFENFGALLGIASSVDNWNSPTFATLVSIDVIRDWVRQNVPGY
jgi:hypothetical protein